MQVDQSKSDITVTHQIEIPLEMVKGDVNNSQLLPATKAERAIRKVEYLLSDKLLILSFASGQVLFGKLDE